MDETMVAEGLKRAIAGAITPDPFAQVTGTPNLDRFEPSAPLLAPGELNGVMAGVDKALKDKRTGAQVWEALKTVVGIAKTFAAPLILVALLSGCASTPPSIAQAHRMERQGLEAYNADVERALAAYEMDLALALDGQTDLIRDYELKLAVGADGKVDLPRVMALLDGAKAKRAEIAGKLTAARAKIKSVGEHYRTAITIHDRIGAYLEEPEVGASDAAKLISGVAELRASAVPMTAPSPQNGR